MRTPSVAKPIPLALLAQRLAPFVATALIPHDEALATLLETAADRGMLTSWERGHALREWLSDTLDRAATSWRQRADAGGERQFRQWVAEAEAPFLARRAAA